MVTYSCERCWKEFSQKSRYDAHKRRKTPCVNNADKVKQLVDTAVKEKLAAMGIQNIRVKKKKFTIKEPKPAVIKYIDLFCGIGSFHYSFEKMGWECILACDIEKSAQDTYQENYKMKALGDIYKIDPSTLGHYDILCAGFPCQPFSQAGFHKGFEDKKNKRGVLFYEIMRFVKINKPNIIVLENVQGLKNHDNGRTFATVQAELENEDYTLEYKVLKCSDYGLPQMRKRIFIIGVKKGFPLKHDIKEMFHLDKYKQTTTLSAFFGKQFEKDTAYTIRCGGRRSDINNRHNWDGYIVDGEEYRLTIDDALKLQGFSNFKLIGTQGQKWKMLGNTIPTRFTEIIGKQLKYIMGA